MTRVGGCEEGDMGPMVILVIVLTAVVTVAVGAAWGQLIEHRRRSSAMEVIKAAMLADKEPPREVLDELARVGQRRAPWNEVISFTALAVGFWVAWARTGSGDESTAFLVVAVTMTVTAAGLFVLALASAGKPRDHGT